MLRLGQLRLDWLYFISHWRILHNFHWGISYIYLRRFKPIQNLIFRTNKKTRKGLSRSAATGRCFQPTERPEFEPRTMTNMVWSCSLQLGTPQHCRDNMTMFSGYKFDDCGIITTFVADTPVIGYTLGWIKFFN